MAAQKNTTKRKVTPKRKKRSTPLSKNAIRKYALRANIRIVSGNVKETLAQEAAQRLIALRTEKALINMENSGHRALSVTHLIEGNDDLTALGLETSNFDSGKRKKRVDLDA